MHVAVLRSNGSELAARERRQSAALRYTVCVRAARRLLPAFFLVLLAAAVQAPSGLEKTYNALRATGGVHEVALAPDGSRAAWVQNGNDIYVAELKSGGSHKLASGHDISWSPDSRRLAYLSGGESATVYVIDSAGGQPGKLAGLNGYAQSLRWSPDGSALSVLYTENAPRAAGPLVAASPQTGVIGARIYYQRIAVIDASSGGLRQVSPPDLYVYEYDWSSDGRRFAATAAPGPGDNNWYIAKLYVIDAASGRTEPIHKPPLQIADPRWSPDGTSIAYIGGLMSDEGATGGDIMVVPATGGDARDVTPGLPSSPASIRWLANGHIFFGENIDGESGFAEVDPASGRVEQLWRGAATVSVNGWLPSLSLSRDGSVTAMTRHSFDGPPEVYAGPLGKWRRISEVNPALERGWSDAKSLHWTGDAGVVQGWLIYPRGYDPAKRWPMIVWVHGGPSGMERAHWPAASIPGMLAADGYFVLLPNPRGSFGSGEAFTQANRQDFGYGDFRDILNGVDEVVRTLPVDNDRIGITGWSYGGYMTMWAVTQTNRFRAAMAGAGLANWQSYYGENLIDQWMIPFFGASVYDDPAVYARSSPITFIKKVKTPTLIIVGERHAECPAPQSFEFWHALKTLGVDTQLIVYPNEGHSFSDEGHQRDVVLRTLDWFDKRLKVR